MKIVKQKVLAGFLNRNDVLAQSQGLNFFHNVASKKQFWIDFHQAKTFRTLMAVVPIPTPTLTPLPATAAPYITRLENTDSFQESFGGRQYSFQSVNISALQPGQTFANIDSQRNPPSQNNLQALLKYCLPINSTLEAGVTHTPTGIRFITNRYGHGMQNLRVRIKKHKAIFSLEHPNLIQVWNFIGNINGLIVNRLIIANGNHRSLKLLNAGYSNIPALVLNTSDMAELSMSIPQGLGFWNANYQIMDPRPPLISDFMSPLAIEYPCVLPESVIDVNFNNPK